MNSGSFIKRNAFFALALLAALACAAESTPIPPTSTTTSPTPTVSSSNNDDTPTKDFWTVHSPEEAEIHAGFRPIVPSYLPAGLEATSIHVNTLHIVIPKRYTEQHWNYPGATQFGMMLTQMPGSFSLGGGEDTIIEGLEYTRKLLPAGTERNYPLLSLAWSDNDYSYALTARVSDDLTEAILIDIASSAR